MQTTMLSAVRNKRVLKYIFKNYILIHINMGEKIVLTLLIMLFLLFAYWQYNGAINDDFVFKQQQQQKSNLRQETQKSGN